MSPGKVSLVVPRAESREPGPTRVKSRWDGDLHGKTAALIDSGRPNSDVAVAAIGDHLRQEYGVRVVNVERRPLTMTASAEAARKEWLERLCSDADIIIRALSS